MTIRNPSKPTTVALAATIAALAVAGVSSAALLDDGASAPGPAGVAPVASAPLTSVPEDQARVFGVLRRPAATSVPAEVRAQFVPGAPGLSNVGADLAQARSVTAGGRTFYVVPGSKGICLVLPDGGSVCSADLPAVARNGLSVSVVPPAPGPVKDMGSTIGPGTIVTYGLAPDDVTDVVGTQEAGASVKAQTHDNAYILESDGPLITATFSHRS